MKLSSESITNAFNLRRINELVIQCIVSEDKIKDIGETILNYNDKVKLIYEISNNNEKTIDTLLINLDKLKSEKLIDLENYLISFKRSKQIILDLSGINKTIDNRELILSFINRYNIDIIKGTKEEVFFLITGQKYYVTLLDDSYRDFSKKNETILIIKDKKYWITDGYSEFTINSEKNLLDYKRFEDILIGLIVATTALCSTKEQRVEAILLAIIIFEKSKNLALQKIEIDGLEENIKKHLIQEIACLSSKDIYMFNDIGYKFKRR